MNDGFSAYETNFFNTNFQQSDYYNDQQQQQHTQMFSLPSPPTPTTMPKAAAAINGLEQAKATHCNAGGSVGGGSSFANIPFVQIHTTDVQPQRSSFGNVFRRSASKQEEIKSEPIKSESADAAKERVNGTPTPPARTASSSSSGEKNVIAQSGNNSTDASTNARMVAGDDVSAASVAESSSSSEYTMTFASTVHKCSQCPFISLSAASIESHSATIHATEDGSRFMNGAAIRLRIPCPGCENMFYTLKSLEVHFREDHLMIFDDSKKLLDELKKKYPFIEQQQQPQHSVNGLITNTRGTTNSTQQQQQQTQDTQRKSRIYLKNVECLREPRREPIEQQENLITEQQFFQMNTFENDCNSLLNEARDNNAFIELLGDVNNENHIIGNSIHSINNSNNNNQNEHKCSTTTKQKISIKSVDVLREPALLRRDYEMQGFNSFMNACSDIDLQCAAINNDSGEQYNYSASSGSSSSCVPNANTLSSNAEANHLSNNMDANFQKPRRPKIYIKNVDILKEPMMLSANPNIQESLLLNDSMNFSFMPQSNGPGGGGGATGGGAASHFLNSSDNSSTPPAQIFDDSLTQQLVVPMVVGNISEQYLFESAAGVQNNNNNHNNNNNSFMPTVNVVENFSYVNGQSSNCFLLDNTRFDCLGISDLDALHTSSATPLITEPTPPPPPIALEMRTNDNALEHGGATLTTVPATNPAHQQKRQKQKIFIKNVDILKEPQFQEQHRGTLHLRTVDELNLMNKNDVENLITPNLENTQSGNCSQTNCEDGDVLEHEEENENLDLSDSFNHLTEHVKLTLAEEEEVEEEDAFYADDSSFKLQDFEAAQVVRNWGDDYDLGEDIDCIITDTISPMNSIATTTKMHSATQKTTSSVHDLETPQMSLISIRDIDELTGGGGGQQTHQLSSLFQQQEMERINCTEMMLAPLDTDVLAMCSEETADDAINQDVLLYADLNSISDCHKNSDQNSSQLFEHGLKQERGNTATELTTTTTTTTSTTTATSSILATTSFMEKQTEEIVSPSATAHLNEVPPLAPVTTTSSAAAPPLPYTTTLEFAPPPPPLAVVTAPLVITSTTLKDNTQAPVNASSIPMPPLVFSGISQHNPTTAVASAGTCTSPVTSHATPVASQPSPVERGRIYVASNLMETTSVPEKQSSLVKSKVCGADATIAFTGGTSVRGRPFGSNRTGITKMRKMYGNVTDIEVGIKCTVQACAFRFKKPETLDYHKRCHNSNSATSPQSMLCPECKSTGFNNWNTLHTHLWRSHQIDMELYSCELCPFKTPVYSRLINTHSKIHSEDRNFKCNLCNKAFKNTKQLKNHRRWHRNHIAPATSTTTSPNSTALGPPAPPPPQPAITLHYCNDCGAVFSHPKTLRSHLCKNADTQVQCEICGRVVSSKSSLKLHMLTHETTKRFKCSLCEYEANDHNAFRRHKMTHDNTKMYICPYCSYKSIQSVAFQKHVQQKHPEVADTIIHKCNLCPFSTINQSLFAVHQAKHESFAYDHQHDVAKETSSSTSAFVSQVVINDDVLCLSDNQTEITLNAVVHAQEPSKIKVKSNLMLTNPANFCNSGIRTIAENTYR